jgi:predicted transcriptional regulator
MTEVKNCMVRLREDVDQKIKDYASVNRISKSKAIEDAIVLYLKEHSVDGQQS